MNLQNQNQNFWEELFAYFPWYDADRKDNDASNDSSIVACVFVAEVRLFPEWLRNNDRGD
jgi:hypothetical protein